MEHIKSVNTQNWDATFTARHPCFSQITTQQQWADHHHWPGCDALNQQLPKAAQTHSGRALRFVPQDEILPYPNLYYEKRISQHGLIATRSNWHDFFNALIWTNFPLSKAAINAAHCREMDNGNKSAEKQLTRTPHRDALTLFDETGCIVVASNKAVHDHIQDFQWIELFTTLGDYWRSKIICQIFGHAMFEKLLTPYIGATANAILVLKSDSFFTLPENTRNQILDEQVANAINNDQLLSTRYLTPFPLLGIAGWWPEQPPEFYKNRQYFRNKTITRQPLILVDC